MAFAYVAGGGVRGAPAADFFALVVGGALGLLGTILLTRRARWLRLAVGFVEALVGIAAVAYLTHAYGSDGPVYLDDPGTKGIKFIGYAHYAGDLLTLSLVVLSAVTVLTYVVVWPRSIAISSVVASVLAGLLLATCTAMAFAWYEQGQMVIDRLGGWTGIEGHADLGFGVDAPINDLVIVDQTSGATTAVTRDRNGWIRMSLPPGRYTLSVCPAGSRAPMVRVTVPDRGYASLDDALLAPVQSVRDCGLTR